MPSSSILVLGGGSAGFLAAITAKVRNPDFNVTVLRSPEIGIIGVGEASTPSLTDYLHGYLDLDPAEFYREVNPGWKLGIRFLWGPRERFFYSFQFQCDLQYNVLAHPTGYYYNDEQFGDGNRSVALMGMNKAFARQPGDIPLVDRDTAYHLENERFVSYLEKQARRIGIEIREGTVNEVLQDERGIAGLRLATSETVTADLYVDCSGFRSLLLGKTLSEPFRSFKASLFNNRAIFGGWMRGENEAVLPYTTAETMEAGWCWRIDHPDRINRGYVYGSDFISDEDAEAEFRKKNPQITETRFTKFVTGCYERAWVKNVVAIGNAAGFVEPLESTALGVICSESNAFAETIRDFGCEPGEPAKRQFNNRHIRSWNNLRSFLAIHFRFNTRLETAYWQACCREADLAGGTEIVEYFQEYGPSLLWRTELIDATDQFKLDGYLTLLIGQRVPYRRRPAISAEDQQAWQRIRSEWQQQAADAFTPEEALAIIRRPEWQWNKDFWKRPRNTGG